MNEKQTYNFNLHIVITFCFTQQMHVLILLFTKLISPFTVSFIISFIYHSNFYLTMSIVWCRKPHLSTWLSHKLGTMKRSWQIYLWCLAMQLHITAAAFASEFQKWGKCKIRWGLIFLKKCTASVGLKNGIAMLTNIQNKWNDGAPVAHKIDLW